MSVVRNFLRNPRKLYALACQRVCMSSDSQQPGWGKGAGAGGGSGGAIRNAGGAFGEREAAKEEEYFRRLSGQQLDTLKESLHDEIKYHKEEIEDHQKAIQRHKKKLEDLENLGK